MFWALRVHSSPTVPSGTSLAVAVDDAHLHPRVGLAAGAQQLRAMDRIVIFGVELDDGSGRLGQAVHLDEIAAHGGNGPLQYRSRDGRGPVGQ